MTGKKMNTKKLYHADIFIPAKYHKIENIEVKNFYPLSPHVVKSANAEKNGQILIPDSFTFSFSEIVEIEEYNESKDIKFLIRLPYNKINDLCIVVLFSANGSAKIKTVWLNNCTDSHKTLNRSKYAKN